VPNESKDEPQQAIHPCDTRKMQKQKQSLLRAESMQGYMSVINSSVILAKINQILSSIIINS
jgi:hypothetical protein